MAVTAAMFGNWPAFILGDPTTPPTVVINLETNNRCKTMLTTSTYSPVQDTHKVYTDVTNEVANGNGYTTTGAAMGTGTITGPTTRVVTWDAPDVTWSTSTITARRSVTYDDIDSTDRLICWLDFGADVPSGGGDFKITWAAGGIFTITVAALA